MAGESRTELPADLVRAILDKADGNPLLIEELARSAVEQTGRQTDIVVAGDIREVIGGRIKLLPDEPKRLLQAASVVGQEIPRKLLEAVWKGAGDLDSHLQMLGRLDFLYDQMGGEEVVYVFKHPLTREAAYGSLTNDRRQALHAEVGRALEDLYRDRLEAVYGHLAYQYSSAGETDRAVEYLKRSAEEASRVYAHAEAVRDLQEATRHMSTLPVSRDRDRRVIELVLDQAKSLHLLGRFRQTLDLFLSHQERLGQVQDPALDGPYYFWLSHTHSYLGNQEEAAQNARLALQAANRCADQATLGKAHYVLAREGFWSGQPHEGIAHGLSAITHLERTEERWWIGHTYWAVGFNYSLIGEFERALEYEDSARVIGEAMEDPHLRADADWTTGWIYTLVGEWDRGIEFCKRGLERLRDPVANADLLGHLGYAYLEKGEARDAIPLLEQAIQEFGEFKPIQGWFTTWLSEAYLLDDQIDKASHLALKSLNTTRDARFRIGVGWAQRVLGRIARVQGDLRGAEAYLKDALETFTKTQARFETGRTHLALAELAREQRSKEAMRVHLQEAYRLFNELRVANYLERTERLASSFC